MNEEAKKHFDWQMANLQKDCPFCKLETEKYLKKLNLAFSEETLEPVDHIEIMFYKWDCMICDKVVYPADNLPLSIEAKKVKEYEDMGHIVVFHPEYDAYLNYSLAIKVGDDCEDSKCDFCREIDWNKIKEEFKNGINYSEA